MVESLQQKSLKALIIGGTGAVGRVIFQIL
jgi:hypothetical protein